MTQDREHIHDMPFEPVTDLAEKTPEAILHLRQAVQSGVPWCQALLEAIALWTLPREVYQSRTYQYLIQGEALDWLLLAERLCAELEGAVPAEAQEELLFCGKLPEEITQEDFKELIGGTKHRAYLNYWYGVVVEEALQLAVEEEVRKRHRARCYPDSEDLIEEAFTHLYGANRDALLEEFRRVAQLTTEQHLTLTNLKEFTYWLSKRRFHMWDPARVASDTRKGIRRLEMLEQAAEPVMEPA
ncbi:MAG: hypothetical protein ACE5Q6_00390 [Dehalococcoidia bacterium]